MTLHDDFDRPLGPAWGAFQAVGRLAGTWPTTRQPYGDDQVLTTAGPDTGPGEWLVRCTDCPTTHDEDYGCDRPQEWTFNIADRPKAEAFAARHRSLQGHKVTILRRITLTPQPGEYTVEVFDKFWNLVARTGDAGAVLESLERDR